MESRATRAVLVVWVIGVLLFLFVPIGTIVIFAFDRSNVQSWPIHHFTTSWFGVAWHDQQVRDALWLSMKAGLAATVIALTLDETGQRWRRGPRPAYRLWTTRRE